MNQVYFIHLVLARLSRRQAFGADPNVSAVSLNLLLLSPHRAWGWAFFLLGVVSIVGSTGCVGTRGGPPARFAPKPAANLSGHGAARMGAFAIGPNGHDAQHMGAWDFQPAIHQAGYETHPPQHSLPCRMGLMGKRMEASDASCNCAEEASEDRQPRGSLTLPWLKGNKAKPPEVSRFLPVPTHPVFEPQPNFEMLDW